MRNYTFVKNVTGGLTITLDSWNMQLPTRDFRFTGSIEQITIPEEYALGLFVSDGAMYMLRNGYFTIANYHDLQKKAKEIGLFADDEILKVYSKAEIEKFLLKQDSKKIAEIIKRDLSVEMDNLIALAREHLDKLPSNIITQIEDACGAELRIE